MEYDKDQENNLEQALLERATRLAQEYLQRAEEQREDIYHDSREKLQLGEERELLSAREKAERRYQQLIQASELHFQGELDRLRSHLVKQVQDQLLQSLENFAKDESKYISVFSELFKEAVYAVEADDVVVQVNEQDYDRLSAENCRLLNELVPDKKIVLHDEVCQCRGGVKAWNPESSIRVDNTFEGRLAATQEKLQQIIMEQLFSKALTTGEMLHG